jgi:hypothetical protein
MAFAPTDEVLVLGVVPAAVPPLADDVPCVLEVPARTPAGAVSTPEDGVYFTELVVAFDPADADADEAKEVTAPAPLAPDDALLWMYRSPRFPGSCCHCGALSSTT